jgi:hypothetical protein
VGSSKEIKSFVNNPVSNVEVSINKANMSDLIHTCTQRKCPLLMVKELNQSQNLEFYHLELYESS